MTRTRSLAASLLLGLLAVLVLPGTARATTTGEVAQALLGNPVYVDPKATVQVDADRLRKEISGASRPVYVAVLPAAAASANGGPAGLTSAIGQGLGDTAILFTVSGTTLSGGAGRNSGLAPGEAARIAADNRSGDLTGALANSIRQAADSAADGSSGTSSGGNASGGSNSSGSGGGGAVLGLLALLGLGGGGLLYARSRKRRQGEMAGSRADVESLYNRLGADVANLSPGDDPVARQALADAAERYNATGALLAQSDTAGEFAAARRTVVEGLTAARLVRTRLGLDPGPQIPPPPGSGPQMQAPERVQVGEQEYDGSPTYAPGRQHYFGGGYLGGRMVPGGWYGVPFWETMLIGSALSGGFGGYGGGGFERGYEEGVEDARDAHSGDDGGGFGGGDWGGGGGFSGGDWGGGGGFSGGDWGGGGGGDWGGGGGGGDGGGSW